MARRFRASKVLRPHDPRVDGPPPEHEQAVAAAKQELVAQMVGSGLDFERTIRAYRERFKSTRAEAEIQVRTIEAEYRDRARGRKELEQLAASRRLKRSAESMFQMANDVNRPDKTRVSAANAHRALEAQLAELMGLNEPERKIVEVHNNVEVLTRAMSQVTEDDLKRELVEEMEREQQLRRLLPPSSKGAN